MTDETSQYDTDSSLLLCPANHPRPLLVALLIFDSFSCMLELRYNANGSSWTRDYFEPADYADYDDMDEEKLGANQKLSPFTGQFSFSTVPTCSGRTRSFKAI